MSIVNKFYEKARYVSQTTLNVIENQLTRPWSRLLLVTDSARWVLDEEAKSLRAISRSLGIPARIASPIKRNNACIHYLSQFALQEPDIYFSGDNCRYSMAYFHGGPDDNEFAGLFDSLIEQKNRITKLHISNSILEQSCLSAGFSKHQLAKIPIGVNIHWFEIQTEASRRLNRERLGISQEAFVIGSFQKDGVGWEEGFEPKLIKGPDVFAKVLRCVKDDIPNIHVLLSGPARGYLKKELAKSGIPCTHVFYKNPKELNSLYQALDVYLVASRVEGGPKSVLESMASGVPLVTTRVGQAADLVEHGVNGWMVESENIEGLAEGIIKVKEDRVFFEKMLPMARRTAESEDYIAQAPRWRRLFFDGYVE